MQPIEQRKRIARTGFALKVMSAALLGIGVLGGGVLGHTVFAAASDDPLLGIEGVCQLGGQRGALLKNYLRVAAAKNELKPFGRAVADTKQPSSGDDGQEVPLWKGLGSMSYAIATSRPLAQRYFDQGLQLAYGFNHAEARRSFQKAQRIDPDCAMCYWGEALVLGPNINAPMDSAANAPAFEAVRRARALAGKASAREQGLIDALSARYSDDPKAERAQLDAAYASRMAELAQAYPKDDQIAVLTAEALMDTQPWDYWEAGGTRPKGQAQLIVDLLEKVLARNPDHPGAIHYYIHAVEASSDPHRAEKYAERMGKLVPGAGHLVHMPSHIYYRVGRYLDSLAVNKAAVAADERYLRRASNAGLYPQAYYPHAIHMLMVSAQMAGDGVAAIDAAEKLAQVVSDEAVRTVPWVQPIKAAVYTAHAQFSPPERVLAIADPGDAQPFVKGLWHYARAVALAAGSDVAAAERELESIQRLAATDFSALAAGGVPATDILDIAHKVARARIAQAQGDLNTAATALEAAVVIEDRLGYTEPPHWYYPVRQSLGAVLVQLGQFDRAEEMFRASLARAPNNGWSLYGLQQVYQRRGETRSAKALQRRLAQAWAGSTTQLDLKRL